MKRKQSNALLAAITLFSLFFNSVLTAGAQVGAASEDMQFDNYRSN